MSPGLLRYLLLLWLRNVLDRCVEEGLFLDRKSLEVQERRNGAWNLMELEGERSHTEVEREVEEEDGNWDWEDKTSNSGTVYSLGISDGRSSVSGTLFDLEEGATLLLVEDEETCYA
jgi:hypothetical protein